MDLASNCVEFILFYGHKGELVEKMAETCQCEEQLAMDFINKYFHFLTKEEIILGGIAAPHVQCKTDDNESESESE